MRLFYTIPTARQSVGRLPQQKLLNREEVFEAMENLASIPQHRTTWGAGDIESNAFLDQWPYKVLFAFDGVSAESVKKAMLDFSTEKGNYPRNRQPDMIHVLGKYRLNKFWKDMPHEGRTIPAGRYVAFPVECDVAAMVVLIATVQQIFLASRFFPYHYSDIFQRMFDLRATGDQANP